MTIPEENIMLYESAPTARMCHVLNSLNLRSQLFHAETIVITVGT